MEKTKFHYFLPTNQQLTYLIVIDAHNRYAHSGLNSTITLLHEQWFGLQSSFLLASRRFISWRSLVSMMISENATCSQSAARELTRPSHSVKLLYNTKKPAEYEVEWYNVVHPKSSPLVWWMMGETTSSYYILLKRWT